jgi:hypothetical protein
MFSLTTYGQKGKWKPFKLLVIQPDTAIISSTLNSDRDSIIQSHLDMYYRYVKQQEDILNCKPCDSLYKEKIKTQLPQLKAQEAEVKKFKYLQTISNYSTQVFNFYFNEYEPFSTIVELPNQLTDLPNLKLLADSTKADYIVSYSNIHTVDKEGLPILKLTTSLYSKKENKIILTKQTDGDTNSRGDMWSCNRNVVLSCLLINGVRTSTDEVANVLRKRQIK